MRALRCRQDAKEILVSSVSCSSRTKTLEEFEDFNQIDHKNKINKNQVNHLK